MKNFAVIGDPIEHSLSPILHNWVFEKLNIDASYSKIQVTQSELNDYIGKLRNGELNGINVTIPHKTNIMDFLDEINPRAESIGAVNVIMSKNGKIIGNNTDWYGFSLALRNNNIEVCGKSVLVIGGGGVSKGIMFALKQMGVNKIHLFNRTFEKISQLCDEIIHPHKFDQIEDIIQDDFIIINGTSVGMLSNESPIKKDLLAQSQIVIDTIYTPLKTKLLCDSERSGATILNGLDMFIYQALASQDLWIGEPITSKVDVSTLRNHLINVLKSR